MKTAESSDGVDQGRRSFLGAAAVTVAAFEFGKSAPAKAAAIEQASGKPLSTARTSFPSIKQIDAGVLNVGYAELGPAKGPAVILLHG